MRIVVGLHEDRSAEAVTAALVGEGASSVRSTGPAQPGVLVADFPSAEPGDAGATGALLDRISRLPGVRYAEPDEMQTAF